jgi:flagellar biosynthesis chaperone FliJ
MIDYDVDVEELLKDKVDTATYNTIGLLIEEYENHIQKQEHIIEYLEDKLSNLEDKYNEVQGRLCELEYGECD